ncbi:MAG: hypothetical protein DMG02_00625 [Acidobacteria bacterium]|nr:MAG: hypothetical protein DMG02_00625 [Acidobacteriota bacterium]
MDKLTRPSNYSVGSVATKPVLGAGARPTTIPLSYAQQGIWLLERIAGGQGTAFNQVTAWRIRGPVNIGALEKAVNAIVGRHEVLRTTFVARDGIPRQVISPEASIQLGLADIRGNAAPESQWSLVQAALREECETPFDLEHGPMIRARLLRLEEGDSVFVKTVHHIASDAWSQGLFNKELTVLYDATGAGRLGPLYPAPLQYADFALWQRASLESGMQSGLDYWRRELAGSQTRLELSTDRPHSSRCGHSAGEYRTTITSEQLSALGELGRQCRSTLFMTLLTAFGILLSRYSGLDDLLVGTPVANRDDSRLHTLLGCFVNTIPLRLRVKPREKVRDMIAAVRRTVVDAMTYRWVPFECVVDDLVPRRDLGRPPLVQVIFVTHSVPWSQLALPFTQSSYISCGAARIYHDIEIHVWEHHNAPLVIWRFNRDLFDVSRIERMARDYSLLLDELVVGLDRAIGELQLRDVPAAGPRSSHMTSHCMLIPQSSTLPSVLETVVTARPDATAAMQHQAGGLTYGSLNDRANQLAHYLISKGIGAEQAVGLAMPTSFDLLIAMTAILKAGAAYLPLDPDHPTARLSFMIADAAPTAILTTRDVVPRLGTTSTPLILLDDPDVVDLVARMTQVAPNDHDRVATLMPSHTAYIIYTSGSTGRPKGVVVSHASALTFIQGISSTVSHEKQYRQLAHTTISFDISFLELMVPLCMGATVIMVLRSDRNAPDRLWQIVHEAAVTTVQATPTLWKALIASRDAQLDGMRVLSGGETLPMSTATVLCEAAEAWNLYGPTEATVWAAAHRLSEPELSNHLGRGVPIGRALEGYDVFVLSDSLVGALFDVPGELYIAGIGVARGYLNRPGLTAERFVPNPFGQGDRMYRTGDRGRVRTDGVLEYLGRVDNQIKVRGGRVELGEIEECLLAMPDIAEAAAVVKDDRQDAASVTAYVVPKQDRVVSPSVVRRYLRTILPEYMVPASIVTVSALPRTTNNKVDRLMLSDMQLGESVEERSPKTALELILCQLYSEVLGIDNVSAGDDFFALGGNSLVATRLLSRIRAECNVDLPVATIFESPAVFELAERVMSDVEQDDDTGDT